MNRWTWCLVSCILALCTAFSIKYVKEYFVYKTAYAHPKIEYRERIVFKENKNVKITEKITEKNGEKVTERVTEDKSVTAINSDTKNVSTPILPTIHRSVLFVRVGADIPNQKRFSVGLGIDVFDWRLSLTHSVYPLPTSLEPVFWLDVPLF